MVLTQQAFVINIRNMDNGKNIILKIYFTGSSKNYIQIIKMYVIKYMIIDKNTKI